MPKVSRPMSSYAVDAITRLVQLIRKARIERRMTVAALAERAGISRGLMQRIEAGDPGCTIGAVFEVAAIVGVRLFDADRTKMARDVETQREVMALLPRAVRSRRTEADDDF